MFYIRIILTLVIVASIAVGNAVQSADFSDAEKATILSLSLDRLPPAPASPSNQYAYNTDARMLGERLFFDPSLSQNGEMACSTCHQPDKFFTDGLTRSIGDSSSSRNTPTVVGSAWLRWFYWDGRKDSLWSQALIPLEASNEMGSNRVAAVRYIARNSDYRLLYERVFGPLPGELLDDQLPNSAGPFGEAVHRENWDALSSPLKIAVNEVFVNIGKALAAYQRSLEYEPTRFDTFTAEIASDAEKYSLSADELAGLKLFIDPDKTQCLQCHNGPLLTNQGFHNIGTGEFHGQHRDLGRMVGLYAVLQDEFNCLGPYSDAQAEDCHSLRFLNQSAHIPVVGAFKTPSLRNLSRTAPYFHDGRFKSLKEVVRFYNVPPEDESHELNALNLSDEELGQLVLFLRTLSTEPTRKSMH